MPNWVVNQVVVTGPEAELALFFKRHFRIDQEDGLILDFETVVPKPAVVLATGGAADGELGLVALGLDLTGGSPYGLTLPKVLAAPWVREAGIGSRAALLANLETHQPGALAAAQTMIACHRSTGFIDWYAWSLHHWGTKWNAGPTSIIASDSHILAFVFDTAWSTPEPIFRRLGIEHPALAFAIEAIDPGDSWAVTGEVFGAEAWFESADTREVYERIYGCPPERIEDEEEIEPA